MTTRFSNRTSAITWLEFSPQSGEKSASALQVSQSPVTVAQFAGFVRQGYQDESHWSPQGWQWRERLGIVAPSYWMEPGYSGINQPVTGISFYEAEAFAHWSNARLPTEAEWEFLASNGGTSRYPWGDDTQNIPMLRANLSFFGTYRPQDLTDVFSFPAGANFQGVLDLLGNVSEWCYPGGTPSLETNAEMAVLRGGCSWHDPGTVDRDFRDEVTLEVRDNQTGIRLIRPVAFDVDAPARFGGRVSVPSQGGSCDFSPVDGEAAPTADRQIPVVRKPIARPSRPFRQEGIPSHLEESTWRLTIEGAVTTPLHLSLAELKARYPRVTYRGLFVCVCRWGEVNSLSGFLLRDILEDIRPLLPYESLYLLQKSVAGPEGKVYESTISLADAVRHHAILCDELDEKPLTLDTGWPLRLIDLHLFAYKQVKCLSSLCVTTEFKPGWWEVAKRYDPQGVVQSGTITIVGDNPRKKEIDGPSPVEFVPADAFKNGS